MNNRIRYFRTREKLTLEYLSFVSHVSIGYLSQLELGYKSNPSVSVMESIAKALCKDVHDVFFL